MLTAPMAADRPTRRNTLALIRADAVMALHSIVTNEQALDADRIEAARLLLTASVSETNE